MHADTAGLQRISDIDKMRELSDRFGVNSVPRLVEVAMRQGLGGKNKDLHKVATDVLSRKADGQILRPPQQQRGGAVASEGDGMRWQIDVGNMVNFRGNYPYFLIAVDPFSKFVRGAPLPSTKAADVVMVFERCAPPPHN